MDHPNYLVDKLKTEIVRQVMKHKQTIIVFVQEYQFPADAVALVNPYQAQ